MTLQFDSYWGWTKAMCWVEILRERFVPSNLPIAEEVCSVAQPHGQSTRVWSPEILARRCDQGPRFQVPFSACEVTWRSSLQEKRL